MKLEYVRRAVLGYPHTMDDGPGATPAAVALILSETAGEAEALFIRRAVRAGDPWSGHVGLPGGMRDGADPNLLVTAARETREEIGVDLRTVLCLAQLSDVRTRTPRLPPVYVRPFVWALDERPTLALSGEVEATFWVPLVKLLTPGARRDLDMPGLDRPVRAYVIGAEVIWGLTERILTPFLEVASRDL